MVIVAPGAADATFATLAHWWFDAVDALSSGKVA